MTTSNIHGIHHLTAIASDPQANMDFYAGLLGLRLVKKTVNFDDPSAYHLYYGDATGTPGTIVTFFTWPAGTRGGHAGHGQVARISFSAAPDALGFWHERLARHGVTSERVSRFGEDVLAFSDPDGIAVEIVSVAGDPRTGWPDGPVPAARALRGLHTAELHVAEAGPTENLLIATMGYRLVRRSGDRARFETGAGGSGTFVDVVAVPDAPPAAGGVGTIHHIAWRVADDRDQLRMQDVLSRAGFPVSPVRDRNYFRSIYYRERGGVLFEIATDAPGFPVDEPVGALGTALKLPGQFEQFRTEIERLLPSLRVAKTYA